MSRFVKSEQTVRQFCLDEGVSLPSFYQWKKKLTASDDSIATSDSAVPNHRLPKTNAFKPVELRAAMQTATTIRLGGDIEIQLGNDLPTVVAVVEQLVKHATDSARNQGC